MTETFCMIGAYTYYGLAIVDKTSKWGEIMPEKIGLLQAFLACFTIALISLPAFISIITYEIPSLLNMCHRCHTSRVKKWLKRTYQEDAEIDVD